MRKSTATLSADKPPAPQYKSSDARSDSRSDARTKPAKPTRDFPLYPHATRRWAKKIRGKTYFFGPWSDPDGALARYLEQKDYLQLGVAPPVEGDQVTVKLLINKFLASKRVMVQQGELSERSWRDYHRTGMRLAKYFGPNRLLKTIRPDDFEGLRRDIAKSYGPVALGNEIQRTRTVFKFAYEMELIDRPVKYGTQFARPAQRVLRRTKRENGSRMFEAAEIRRILDAAGPQMRAMVLLGVNCGFGNHDVAGLRLDHVDLERGWIDYPRPKTEIDRRSPLWPETVEALRVVLDERTEPDNPEHARIVFITKYGQSWHGKNESNPLSAEFKKLLLKIGREEKQASQKEGREPLPALYRKGRGFYALRHVTETIGGESRDQVAVDALMGHVDGSMAAQYRERISDQRLQAVTETIRAWLFSSTVEG